MNKKTIALIGAGGKMGQRIAPNLKKFNYNFICCERDTVGLECLKAQGYMTLPTEAALPEADVVIFALPDALLPALSEKLIPLLQSGAIVITLDPAAARAKRLALRNDCSFFVTHPCHPPLFGDKDTPEEKADLFGGIAAKQDIVLAELSKTADVDTKKIEELCRHMFNPVVECHLITVEQMAILEPAAAEVVVALCATIMKEAIDEAISRGVPEKAARSFLMGHIQIPLAIVLKSSNPFSDAAKIAVEYGRKKVLRDDWKKVFEPEAIEEVLELMLSHK